MIPIMKGRTLEGNKLRVEYWVQCRGVLLIWIIVGQGLIALAVGADGACLEIFPLVYLFCFLSASVGDGLIKTEM